MHKP